MRNIVVKKPVEIDLDDIKARFINGASAGDIARSYDRSRQSRVINLISVNRRRWNEECRYAKLQSDETKTVIRRPTMQPNGTVDLIPVSLPNITMHRRALEELRHA